MTKILIIDDDPDLCVLVSTILEREGYQTDFAYNGRTGLEKTTQMEPDLILLDVMIPGESGWEICEQLREKDNTPIVFLSARGGESDVVRGLKLGADDYISKPFRRHELLARIEAVLRRTMPDEEEEVIYQVGDLVINHTLWETTRAGEPIHLTPTEFELLALLAKRAGKPVPHNDILTQVWDLNQQNNLNLLKVYIRQLRLKVEPDPDRPRYVMTKRGIGYYLATGNK